MSTIDYCVPAHCDKTVTPVNHRPMEVEVTKTALPCALRSHLQRLGDGALGEKTREAKTETDSWTSIGPVEAHLFGDECGYGITWYHSEVWQMYLRYPEAVSKHNFYPHERVHWGLPLELSTRNVFHFC